MIINTLFKYLGGVIGIILTISIFNEMIQAYRSIYSKGIMIYIIMLSIGILYWWVYFYILEQLETKEKKKTEKPKKKRKVKKKEEPKKEKKVEKKDKKSSSAEATAGKKSEVGNRKSEMGKTPGPGPFSEFVLPISDFSGRYTKYEALRVHLTLEIAVASPFSKSICSGRLSTSHCSMAFTFLALCPKKVTKKC